MAYNGYGYSNYSQYYTGQQPDQNANQQASPSSQAYQNPYSPYYQSTGQYAQQSSERGQQYQNKPGIDNSSFQASYYPQSQYQQPSGSDNQNAYSQTQTYLPTSQPTSSNYGYTTQPSSDQGSRSYADNSALGNLAYASTLGRNSPAAGQSQAASRQQSSLPAYQMQQSQVQYQQPQTSVQEPVVQPQRTKTPGSYASAREAVRQAPTQQASPQLSSQTQSRSAQSGYSRPTSAVSQQGTNSPRPNQKPRAGPQSTSSSVVSAQTTKHGQAPSRGTQRAEKSSKAHQISTIMNQNEPPTSKQRTSSAVQGTTQPYHPPGNGADPTTVSSAPTREMQPTTIDPSQIFDQAEFQRRRRAAEEAEAAKRAKKVDVQPVQQQQSSNQQSPQLQQFQSAQQDQSKHVRTDSQAREQIQAEMKAMIEKMREYKAADPSGFSEIWEQFKKVQPPGPARVASQTPQAGKASVPPGSLPSGEAALVSPNASTPTFSNADKGSFQTASGDGSNLPDLGKFPAMRRKTRNDKGVPRPGRGSASSPSEAAQSSSEIKAAGAEQNGKPHLQASPADAGAESMRRAMQAFHNTPTPTPSSQQSSPPAQSPRPTVWPEEKKPKLAETAKKFLEGLEANKGKVLNSADFVVMLNQNPSYDQLCGMLNARGFQFSRAPFAQTLLAVVPQTSGSATTGTPKKARGRPRKDGAAASPSGSLTQAAGSLPKVNQSTAGKSGSPPTNITSYGLPILNGPSNVAPEYKSYYERMRMISAGPPAVSTPTLSKQQAARKRNFSEIVDLSQISDGETQAKKHQGQRSKGDHAGKEQALPPNADFDLILTNADPNQNDTPIPIDPNLEQSTKHSYVSDGNLPTEISGGYFDKFKLEGNASNSVRETMRNMTLVKPINTIEALRHRPLNASTLARDILISKGEHPTERPLNFHLRDLAMNFRSVTTKSDLSTFRWDLVDPGGPPSENVMQSIEGASDSGDARDAAQDASTKDANRIDAAAHGEGPKKFDSILTRGRGRGRPRGRPRVRGLIFGMRYTEGDRSSDQKQGLSQSRPSRGSLLSRGRVRARGASRAHEPTTATASTGTPTRFPVVQLGPSVPKDANANQETPVIPSPRNATPATRVQANEMDVDSPSDTQDEATALESPRRNLMVAASADVLRNTPNLIDQLPVNPSPKAIRISSQSLNPIQQGQKKRGRPPKVRVEIGASSSSTPSVSGQALNSGSIPRKRGRPPGSKNSPFAPKRPGISPSDRAKINTEVPVDGIGIAIPLHSAAKSSPLSYVEPRQQRAPAAWAVVNQYEEENPDTDHYTLFPCLWNDCKIKLHNLDTLKKHVKSIHVAQPPKSTDGGLHCEWKDCRQHNFNFGDLVSLEEHISEQHMNQTASSLGDGPSTHPTVVDPTVYLCDSMGLQVTPYASAVGRPDPLPLHAGIGPAKAYHKAHGNITKEQKHRSVKESLRTHIERGSLPADTELASGEEETGGEDTSEEAGDEGTNDEGTDEEENESEEEGEAVRQARPLLPPEEVSDSVISDSEVP